MSIIIGGGDPIILLKINKERKKEIKVKHRR